MDPSKPTTFSNGGPMLTPAELCERWNGTIREATLATWRSRQTGPKYVKVGGRVLYRISDVEAYEAKNSRGK